MIDDSAESSTGAEGAPGPAREPLPAPNPYVSEFEGLTVEEMLAILMEDPLERMYRQQEEAEQRARERLRPR